MVEFIRIDLHVEHVDDRVNADDLNHIYSLVQQVLIVNKLLQSTVLKFRNEIVGLLIVVVQLSSITMNAIRAFLREELREHRKLLDFVDTAIAGGLVWFV